MAWANWMGMKDLGRVWEGKAREEAGEEGARGDLEEQCLWKTDGARGKSRGNATRKWGGAMAQAEERQKGGNKDKREDWWWSWRGQA